MAARLCERELHRASTVQANLGAGEAPPLSCRHGPPVPAVSFGEADGGDEGASRDRVEELVARRGDGGRRRDGRGEERPRVHGPAQFLDDHTHVDHAHTRPAVGLGDEQAGHAQLGQPLPHGIGGAPRIVEHVAHVGGDRRLLGEEPAHRRAQLFLFRRELEVQAAPVPDTGVSENIS